MHLLAVGRRQVVGEISELVVGNRQLEQVAEKFQVRCLKRLLLVGDVARLEAAAERPALDRLGEDGGRRSLVLDRRFLGRVNFLRVVPPAAHARQLFVGNPGDEVLELRAEKLLADVVG